MKNSYTSDISDEYSKKISPYILIAGVVIALLSLIFDKGASNMKERLFIALAAFSGTVTMCSSFAVMLIVNVPLARATKKYLQYSAVMLIFLYRMNSMGHKFTLTSTLNRAF